MEESLINASINGGTVEVEGLKHYVHEISTKIDQLEQRMNEVEQFYATVNKKTSNTCKGNSIAIDRHSLSVTKQQKDASFREAAAAKRMQYLIRQFGRIMDQLAQDSYAVLFLEPVDVEGLGLLDYYQIIKKPMDFRTIKNQMEGKDGKGYKHVREIYGDARLVFKNAMQYNGANSEVHRMAEILMDKLENKWLKLLPKVTEEEKRLEHEDMQLVQEVAQAKTARDLSNEIYEVDMLLEELREKAVQQCRKMTSEDKKNLGSALSRLCPEDLSKALEIVAQYNPGFLANAEEVDLDIDAQSESTLWRLKFFVKDAAEQIAIIGWGENNNEKTTVNNNNKKRKKEMCDAVKNAKRTKTLPPIGK